MIIFAEVSIGTGSPTPCARCGRGAEEKLPRQSASVLEEIARLAAGWHFGPGPNVAFVGLEPFAHPELPTLIAGATECGSQRIRLSTDAGALSVGGNAAGVVGAGVNHIEVVMLAGAAAHDDLCGRPGLFEAVRAGIVAFRAAADAEGVPVVVSGRVPVCGHNSAHLADAVAALAGMGAAFVTLEPLAGGLDADAVALAEQVAITAGVWLHAPGVSVFPPPVSVVEVTG